jgi:hypothetical protein
VRSRLLVGVGAWLLGAAAATSGSMIAVNQLAHGLLGAQTQQLTEANLSVNADNPAARPVASAPPSGETDDSDDSGSRSAMTAAGSAAGTPSPGQSLSGKWLQSPGGSVSAVCEVAGAYLQVWSPDPGFEADDWNRGPAAVASVIFQGATNSIGVWVSCVGGKPVAHVSHLAPDE